MKRYAIHFDERDLTQELKKIRKISDEAYVLGMQLDGVKLLCWIKEGAGAPLTVELERGDLLNMLKPDGACYLSTVAQDAQSGDIVVHLLSQKESRIVKRGSPVPGKAYENPEFIQFRYWNQSSSKTPVISQNEIVQATEETRVTAEPIPFEIPEDHPSNA